MHRVDLCKTILRDESFQRERCRGCWSGASEPALVSSGIGSLPVPLPLPLLPPLPEP